MPSNTMIAIDVTDFTEAGVIVHVNGPLQGLSDAAWVARAMVDHARTLFAGGKPVLFGGAADPVQLKPSTPHQDSTHAPR